MAVVTAVLSISLKCAALMQFPLPAQNALRLYSRRRNVCGMDIWYWPEGRRKIFAETLAWSLWSLPLFGLVPSL